MSGFVDESILSDFVAESREHLDGIEPDLLDMEGQGSDVSNETVNRVFRAIHSIKGNAGFLALDAVKELSHVMESVLMLVRDGELSITQDMMDVLLRGVDKLRAMVDDIEASDSVPCQNEIRQLQAILDAQPADRSSHEQKREKPSENILNGLTLDPDSVRSALECGMNLFKVTVYPEEDIRTKGKTTEEFVNNLHSLGECLDSSVDLSTLSKAKFESSPFHVVFSTCLEQQLVGIGIEVPDERILLLETDALKKLTETEDGSIPDKDEPSSEEPVVPTPTPPPVSSGPDSGKGRDIAETLRVKVDLLTQLMNSAGELVLGRNQLLRLMEGKEKAQPELHSILQSVDRITTDLQEGILQTRMQPLGTLFSRYPRILRDLSRQLGKEIVITMEGTDIELDKSMIELLHDPLTHIIRNSADHAIESPEERERQGKDRCGRVEVKAYQEGGQVTIAISDDGRGIDPAAIRQKAVEKEIITREEATKMSRRESVRLIFAPGFSTSEAISDISGRGVGMDVVRTNVEKFGGNIDIESEVGAGTTVFLRLPLTLAIMPCLVVGAEGHRFAVPQVNLVELVMVKRSEADHRIEEIQGANVLRLREHLLPLIRLSTVLGIPKACSPTDSYSRGEDRRIPACPRTSPDTQRCPGTKFDKSDVAECRGEDLRADGQSDCYIMVLRDGSNRFGVIVDEVFDSEEIVVKPLSSYIRTCRSFSGNTILGDGRVAMILDVAGLVAQSGLRFTEIQTEEKRRREEEAKQKEKSEAAKQSLVWFNVDPNEYFAIPQHQIRGVDCIDVADIQAVGQREFVQYRGGSLALCRIDRMLPVRPLPSDVSKLFIVVPKEELVLENPHAYGGFLVSRIVDAFNIHVDMLQSQIEGPGLIGAAFIQNRLTHFLDPAEILDRYYSAVGESE